jgi:ribosomal RNA-processing protein 1
MYQPQKTGVLGFCSKSEPGRDGKTMDVFAKKLVDSDGLIRTKAFKTLGDWISKRVSDQSRDCADGAEKLEMKDYLRLWKALFYSMWMADKQMHQRSLAQRIGDLCLIILNASDSDDAVIFYFRAFWETLCREWPTLDRHRLDKYYNLIRRMVSASIECCISRSWSESFIRGYNSVVSETVLHPTRGNVPDSLRMYLLEEICSVYVATLTSKDILNRKISIDAVKLTLDPFLDLIALCTKSSVLKCATERFFPSLVTFGAFISAADIGKHIFSRGETDFVASLHNRKVLYDGGLFLQAHRPSVIEPPSINDLPVSSGADDMRGEK